MARSSRSGRESRKRWFQRVTIPREGTYIVDRLLGIVVFQPSGRFVGRGTGFKYRIRTAAGKWTTSYMQIRVVDKTTTVSVSVVPPTQPIRLGVASRVAVRYCNTGSAAVIDGQFSLALPKGLAVARAQKGSVRSGAASWSLERVAPHRCVTRYVVVDRKSTRLNSSH